MKGLSKICLVLGLMLFCSTEIYAASNLILECLAKEEAKLHKEKRLGALYRLNQEFINELASSNDISLKKHFVDEICSKEAKHSPSVGFLRLLLLVESDIYDLSLSEVDPSMRPFKMGYINEFQKQLPRLFVQYLAALQAEMPTPDCLKKNIPELTVFFERLKYLEEELSTHEVIRDKAKIESIFKKLENMNAIEKKCEQDKREREKKSGKSDVRMKKKQNTEFRK